jgi:NADH-quinone oxidoreductase subunit K
MSVEIMLNAAGIVFVAGSYRWGKADGQVMFLFILAMAAAEVAVGLALLIQIHRRNVLLDSDQESEMKG